MNWQSLLRVGGNLGPRLNLLGIVPTTFLAAFVITLAWSGAPSRSPSWDRVLVTARDLKAGEALLLIAIILFVALLTQPLQRPLVRLLEGYWIEHPCVPKWLWTAAVWGQRRRYRKLLDLASPVESETLPEPNDSPDGKDFPAEESETRRGRAASSRLQRRFCPSEERVLPTVLGNTLRAAEDTSGQRYGLDTVTLWPPLYTVLSPSVREAVDDSRNQLDVAARFSAVLVVCAFVAVIMLWHYPFWMLGFIAGTLLGSWLAYRAAVLAAEGYGVMIRLAYDRHRFDLLSGLHLPLPPDSLAELRDNQLLTERLMYSLQEPPLLHYQHATPDSQITNLALSSSTTDGQASVQARASATPQQPRPGQ